MAPFVVLDPSHAQRLPVSDTQPTWIYRADGAAEIFERPHGADAPDGWSFDLNVIDDPALRTADAISGMKPHLVFGADLELPTDGEPATDASEIEAALTAATARITELEGYICEGIAENQRMEAELSKADADLEEATAKIEAADAALVDATAAKVRLEEALRSAAEEVARERAANAPLNEKIAKLERDLGHLSEEHERAKQRRNR